jgi:hypothetical protein
VKLCGRFPGSTSHTGTRVHLPDASRELSRSLSVKPRGTFDVSPALALSTGVAMVVGMLLFARAAVLLQWRQRQTSFDVYLHPTGFILCGWYSASNWVVGGRKKVTYSIQKL